MTNCLFAVASNGCGGRFPRGRVAAWALPVDHPPTEHSANSDDDEFRKVRRVSMAIIPELRKFPAYFAAGKIRLECGLRAISL